MSPEDEIQTLRERVEALERRVGWLEGRRIARSEPQPVAAPLRPASELAPSPPIPPPLPSFFEPPEPVEARTIETKVGLDWVNRIAVVTCVFAAAFFFKYAVDNEWIGPSGRILLGLLAGLVSIYFANRFTRVASVLTRRGRWCVCASSISTTSRLR